jgi:cell division septation protein DedD
MAVEHMRQFLFLATAGVMLTACTLTNPDSGALTADGQPIVDATVNAPTSVRLIDRDVEAPEVFQTEGQALWDGRPSLGGVWVASPDAKDPQRVIMRNPANGKFVIGALFRREAANPGPKLQISSDAADALGILAGEPVRITVTALRREEAPAAAPDAGAPILDTAETIASPAAPAADVTATAAAAIDKATGTAPAAPPAPAATATTPAKPATEPAAQPAAPAAEPAPAAPQAATGALIQVGIFSVRANAQRAVDLLAKAGITATIREEKSQGKIFWSVTARGDKATLAKIRAAGFADAYIPGK